MVSIRDTEGKKIKIPDSWTSTSTDLFQKIITDWQPELEIKDRSRIKLFSIMIDRPVEFIAESQDDDLESALWECTRYVYAEQMDFFSLPLPKQFTVNGKTVEIPKDLGRLSIGQNIHIRQELTSKDPNSLISLVVAIYLQPLLEAVAIDGKLVKAPFDYHRALKIEKQIRQMPIIVTYPVGFFFLNQLKNSGNVLTRTWRRMKRRLTQSVKPLQNWLTSLSSLLSREFHSLTSTLNTSALILTSYGRRSLMMLLFSLLCGKRDQNIRTDTAQLRKL